MARIQGCLRLMSEPHDMEVLIYQGMWTLQYEGELSIGSQTLYLLCLHEPSYAFSLSFSFSSENEIPVVFNQV